jgi:CRISPR/Cas system CSM-associated protein Csm4 (group 5 of RAMP superfamily)
MARLNSLEDWLQATALSPAESQVRFSSLFPWQGDHLYLPAPRGLWPPPPTSKLHARAARFLPQTVVAGLFDGKPLQENRWEVDGASECLLPAASQGTAAGPFRLAIRSGIAVDRIDPGRHVVHRTACIEFAANAGLWFVAEFASSDARSEWESRVTAAIRLLADSGFGGRRSIGWGHAEIEEIKTGSLTDLVLGKRRAPAPVAEPIEEPPVTEAVVAAPPTVEPLVLEPAPEPPVEPVIPEPSPEPVIPEPGPEPVTPAPAPEPVIPEPEPGPAIPEPPPEPVVPEPAPEPVLPEPTPAAPLVAAPVEPVTEGGAAAAAQPAAAAAVPTPVPTAWWIISLFSPGPEDVIDWSRGAYGLLTRSGRVDSPQASGQATKMVRMVEEGSLLFAPATPRGAAVDVAPDGSPHPVFRAGYAIALPVPFRGHA